MHKVLLCWNGMTSQQVSGGDIYVASLIHAIDEQKEIITTGRAESLLGRTKSSTIRTVDQSYASGTVGILWAYVRRAVQASYRIIRDHRAYRVAIASSPFVCDLLPIALTKSSNRTVILFHLIPERRANSLSAWVRFSLAKFEQRVMMLVIKHRYHTVLVGNNVLKQKIEAMYPDKNVYVAHAGIETQKIDRLPPTGKDPNLAVFIGRLTSQKGIFDLLDAVEAAQKINKKYTLKVIGDGPDRQRLEDAIQSRGIQNVEILGYVDETIKYNLLKHAQYFLFPSYEEGWGIALAEALYSNCVCICYKLDHYNSLFSNFPSYVKLGDVTAFAEITVANMGKQPKIRQKKFILKYDIHNVTRDIAKQLKLS